MTTPAENRKKIAYYIFTKDVNGNSVRIGTAYHHERGNGLNLVINKARYAAFPAKAKPETEEVGA